MIHSFDIEIAQKVGVNAAIIFSNIQFWCAKNKANNQNFYDNTYWTYNSIKAWKELFPYLGEKAIRNALDKLEEYKYIVTGKHGDNPYDHTKSYGLYRFAQKDKSTFAQKGESSLSDCKTDSNGAEKLDEGLRDEFNTLWKNHSQALKSKSGENGNRRRNTNKPKANKDYNKLRNKYSYTVLSIIVRLETLTDVGMRNMSTIVCTGFNYDFANMLQKQDDELLKDVLYTEGDNGFLAFIEAVESKEMEVA